ncbi:type II secretion system F family protein [Zhaonella formicivorans]|uniref:type II secretion system F family protein n=1 Tax=Zhaonella formicivorans TaxID=2528593 RepID=UPI0010E63858|nr:hypothetical protein [Zhaonella formicivorans]
MLEATGIISFALIFFVAYQFSLELEHKERLKAVLRNNFLGTKALYDRLAGEYLRENKFYISVLKYLNSIILRSGIRKYLPWLNAVWLMVFLLLAFLVAALILKNFGSIAAGAYGLTFALALLAVLFLMAAINKQAVRKMYLTFLNVYTGFINVEKNEINALEQTARYMEEPLRSVIRRWCFRYKISNLSIDDFLDGILSEISDREFRKFIKFTRMNLKYGGDYRKALEKMKEQGERLASIYALKSSGAVVGTGAILFMIVLDLLLLFSLTGEPETMLYLKNSLKGQMMLAANAGAILFSLWVIFNINRE